MPVDAGHTAAAPAQDPDLRRPESRREPSRLAIWLGIADNSFTRQKTVKFGDASAVNSGRLWSLVTVAVLIGGWLVATLAGWIDPIYWPPIDGSLYPWDRPERARPGVIDRFAELLTQGYRNVPLWEHVWTSVKRVLLGVFFGALVGVPLGFAMGLNSVARGLLDPVVEFIRPIPPLALIPLVILWLGIDEVAKTFLLFLAAFFIMLIAARSGVSSVASRRCTPPIRWGRRRRRCCATSSCRTPCPRSSPGCAPRWASAGARWSRPSWSPPTRASAR